MSPKVSTWIIKIHSRHGNQKKKIGFLSELGQVKKDEIGLNVTWVCEIDGVNP